MTMGFIYSSHYVTHPTRESCVPALKEAAMKAIDAAGIVHGDNFTIHDVPYIVFTSMVEHKVALADFAGRLTFEKDNNLNSSLYYPFQTGLVRLTLVKTAVDRVGRISVGAGTTLCSTTIVAYDSVKIGRNVLFGPLVTIMDCDGHPIDRREPEGDLSKLVMRPIEIKDNAWIGMGALILKGVTIGRASVVAAHSVVTKSVPDNTIVAGNPARVVKTLA
jgi:acetyltransferase-like isoleucine patch superfamily enzyme